MGAKNLPYRFTSLQLFVGLFTIMMGVISADYAARLLCCSNIHVIVYRGYDPWTVFNILNCTVVIIMRAWGGGESAILQLYPYALATLHYSLMLSGMIYFKSGPQSLTKPNNYQQFCISVVISKQVDYYTNWYPNIHQACITCRVTRVSCLQICGRMGCSYPPLPIECVYFRTYSPNGECCEPTCTVCLADYPNAATHLVSAFYI